jgi:hypothetical protein
MKQVIAIMVLVLIACAAMVEPATTIQKTHNNTDSGFAVLELFTSEGCSSCPPADELLARIQQEGGQSVYVLAYHVDYWNSLGWKDIFSKPEYSRRQYAYNKLFTSQVYTPQVIINGKLESLGSDESTIRDGLKKVQGEHTLTSLKLVLQHKQRLSYETGNITPNDRLVIAIVQRKAVSHVKSGENKGRTISHVQIVRSLSQFDLKHGNKGTVPIQLPQDFDAQGWEVIGLIQDIQTGVIKAAARVS